MTVSPTYPGVYVEEIPSGVHTITGVSTAITAFVGFTPQGPINTPVHIFSFADFQRAFGGLSVDSPLSYCVRDFFQNGGGEGYVVRAALGALPASVTLKSKTAGGTDVLDVIAASAGTWGNNLQIDIDYGTNNPGSQFNMKVTNFVLQNGQMVVGATEIYRNLSMNFYDPNFVLAKLSSSQLVSASINPSAITFIGATASAALTPGYSRSAMLGASDVAALDATHNKLAALVDGRGPYEIAITLPLGGTDVVTRLASLATQVAAKLNNLIGGTAVTAASAGTGSAATLAVTSASTNQRSAVQFLSASSNSATAVLKLGASNGGAEIDASAQYRPAQTGSVSDVPVLTGLTAMPGGMALNVYLGTATSALNGTVPIGLLLWGAGTSFAGPPATTDDLLAQVRAALAATSNPLLAGATASLTGGLLRLLPSAADPNISFEIVNYSTTDTSATIMKIATGTGTAVRNVARYAPGSGITVFAQNRPLPPGNNGTAPGANELTGNEAAKTGMYALQNVDLFNLLVMPEATADSGKIGAVIEAIAYCTRRRAFMIVDTPDSVQTFAQAQAWATGPASPVRSRNSALYFPKLRAPDPLMGGAVGTFASAGAMAGIYARTDAERGVWKAPAGTAATVVGATGLSYTLTDGENGTLNPLGLNCLRTFPVYGTISWGARTGLGADTATDEYKYIPVRRLALFLEESLYRGTQWAVFEPNDEPLWASIRLNLGAFMHLLFAQGAFQGRTPRDAYFVKCDKDTTTQNDIDLGRVNILVGFAPLKPAEFVIIQIQQIAGQIVT